MKAMTTVVVADMSHAEVVVVVVVVVVVAVVVVVVASIVCRCRIAACESGSEQLLVGTASTSRDGLHPWSTKRCC